MSLDRMLGGGAVVFGVFLLMYAIPHNVRSTGGLALNPALFPQVAAWLFIVLGALQMLLGTGPAKVPGKRELLRLTLVTLLTLISLVAMQVAGFLVAMIGLMIAVQVMSYERRGVWLAVTVLAVPVGIWFFFDVLLGRPLP